MIWVDVDQTLVFGILLIPWSKMGIVHFLVIRVTNELLAVLVGPFRGVRPQMLFDQFLLPHFMCNLGQDLILDLV